ncbi:MAG: hypothetical protein U1E15_06260 [Hyphomicrobiales bacterium]
MTVIEVTGVDEDGVALATPVDWNADANGPPPVIQIKHGHRSGQSCTCIGDRVLARIPPTRATTTTPMPQRMKPIA